MVISVYLANIPSWQITDPWGAALVCGVLGFLVALSPSLAAYLTDNEGAQYILTLVLSIPIGFVAGAVVGFFDSDVDMWVLALFGAMVIAFFDIIFLAVRYIFSGLKKLLPVKS